ncbi:MAG: tetratricopeptide repeat protein [Candidatus Riflebacteria bacterium]|nr:tetratricopeptide repeat protein [Candidatus Riflebacteria bacterium]
MKQRNFINAQAYLTRAKNLAPDHPGVKDLEERLSKEMQAAKDACKKLANFYRSSKDLPKAITQYQQILAIDPNDADSRKALAEMNQQVHQIEQYHKTGIVVQADSGRSWDADFYSAVSQMRRARDAYDSGNLEIAKDMVDQILKREKEFGEAKKMRVEILRAIQMKQLLTEYNDSVNKGALQEAIEHLDRLIMMRPNDAKLYLERGQLLLRLKSFQSARKDFFSAVKRGQPFADVRLHLSECAAGLGEFSHAYALGSAHPNLPGVKTSNFLWLCYWKTYMAQIVLLGVALLFLLWACVVTFGQVDKFYGRRSFAVLIQTAKYLVYCYLQDPMSNPAQATFLAKQLRLPWLHYLNALILCRQGKLDASQESFQASMASRALAPRAYFMLGLVRRKLKQSLQEHDFEQMISLVLAGPPPAWTPEFLLRLEREVLESLGVTTTQREEISPVAVEAATSLGMISIASFQPYSQTQKG